MRETISKRAAGFVGLLFSLVVSGCSACRMGMSGVYGNGQSEFKSSSIALGSDGRCLLIFAVGGMGGVWDVVHEDGETFVSMGLTDVMSSEVREHTALLRCGPDKTLDLLVITNSLDAALAAYRVSSKLAADWQGSRYRLIAKEIPDELQVMMTRYPEAIEKARRRAETRSAADRYEQERRRIEQPRYEACLSKIKSDTSNILAVNLEIAGPNDRPPHRAGVVKYTPECRALIDSFKDKSLVFKEQDLLGFLEKYPWDSDFFVIGHIFSRDELTPESRRRLHPRVLDFGNRLSYDLGGAFYEHENTPVDVVQEAYDGKTNVVGFRSHLAARLKREGIVTPEEKERLEKERAQAERRKAEIETRERRMREREEREKKQRAEEEERVRQQQERYEKEREASRRNQEAADRQKELAKKEARRVERLVCQLESEPARFCEAIAAFDERKVSEGWVEELRTRRTSDLPIENLKLLLEVAKASTNYWANTVRFAVLVRPELPADVLVREYEDMLSHGDGLVSHVMKNPNFPKSWLEKAYSDPRLANLRYRAAIHSDFPWYSRAGRNRFESAAHAMYDDRRAGRISDAELNARLHDLMIKMLPGQMPAGWVELF